MLLRALAILIGSAMNAQAAPLNLYYNVTDLGGSYQYDFTLIADNDDGSFVPGMGWDWFIIGVFGETEAPVFPEGESFFTSVPTDWLATRSSGASNGPTLGAVDSSVAGDLWFPTLGESVSFSGVSANLVEEGDLLWSSLVRENGAPGIRFEPARLGAFAPIPLPAAAWMLIAGLGGLGLISVRRRAQGL